MEGTTKGCRNKRKRVDEKKIEMQRRLKNADLKSREIGEDGIAERKVVSLSADPAGLVANCHLQALK